MSSNKLLSCVLGARKPSTNLCFRQMHSEPDLELPTLKRPRTLPSDQFESLHKLTHEIIGRNAGPNSRFWKHTRRQRGEEKLLAKAVQKHALPEMRLSTEREQFISDIQFGEETVDPFPDVNILPGTFVEVRRNNITSHGVTLTDIFHHGQWMIVSLSSSGELWAHLKEDIMIHLPSVVPQDLAVRCGSAAYGENQTEIHARVELLKRIRELELALAGVQNKLNRVLAHLHPKVKSEQPDEWTRITIADVAGIVAPKRPLDFLTRFAIHKYLMDHPKEFIADAVSYRTTHMYHVRPQSHVDRLDKIALFVRHPMNGPIDAFAARARNVIVENRQRAKESWMEPHSEIPRDHNVFTPDDSIIIDFLRDSLRPSRRTQTDPYPIGVARIMKKVGMYPGDINDSMVCQILMDLGVLAPWQDIVTLDKDLGLDQEPEKTSRRVAGQNAIVEKGRAKLAATSTTPMSGEVLGLEDFYSHDMLESIRHDFGNLPVYVIDEAGAEELDDGISIENIPSEPDVAWIHVHIADPTAVLPPTHIFAHEARQKVVTSYFEHRTWPMLPRSLMHTLIASMGDLAMSGKPECSMSFSFKVDGTGDIIDYKVRAGIIRNVTRTTYNAVDTALGCPLYKAAYPFGGETPSPPDPVLNEQQRADIHSLMKVVDRMYYRLQQFPTFTTDLPKASIGISPKPLYTSSVNSLKPPIFRGFPSLTYSVHSSYNEGAQRIVGQCMTAASRVASRWARDHGVPLLRRTASQPMTLSDNDFADLLATKNSQGACDPVMALAKEMISPSAMYTLEPALHWALGIPEGEGYCRVTSPLRRFSDMVAHWQIKHALLHPTSSTPLFSPEWLLAYGRELLISERVHKKAEGHHTTYWALRFIQRWMQSPSRLDRPDPLSHLVAWTTMMPTMNYIQNDIHSLSIVPSLGLRGTITGLKQMELSSAGQIVDVKVKDVQIGVKPKMLLGLQ